MQYPDPNIKGNEPPLHQGDEIQYPSAQITSTEGFQTPHSGDFPNENDNQDQVYNVEPVQPNLVQNTNHQQSKETKNIDDTPLLAQTNEPIETKKTNVCCRFCTWCCVICGICIVCIICLLAAGGIISLIANFVGVGLCLSAAKVQGSHIETLSLETTVINIINYGNIKIVDSDEYYLDIYYNLVDENDLVIDYSENSVTVRDKYSSPGRSYNGIVCYEFNVTIYKPSNLEIDLIIDNHYGTITLKTDTKLQFGELDIKEKYGEIFLENVKSNDASINIQYSKLINEDFPGYTVEGDLQIKESYSEIQFESLEVNGNLYYTASYGTKSKIGDLTVNGDADIRSSCMNIDIDNLGGENYLSTHFAYSDLLINSCSQMGTSSFYNSYGKIEIYNCHRNGNLDFSLSYAKLVMRECPADTWFDTRFRLSDSKAILDDIDLPSILTEKISYSEVQMEFTTSNIQYNEIDFSFSGRYSNFKTDDQVGYVTILERESGLLEGKIYEGGSESGKSIVLSGSYSEFEMTIK